jgi:hypothetical protein
MCQTMVGQCHNLKDYKEKRSLWLKYGSFLEMDHCSRKLDVYREYTFRIRNIKHTNIGL